MIGCWKKARPPLVPADCILATMPPTGVYPWWRAIIFEAIDPALIPSPNPARTKKMARMIGKPTDPEQAPIRMYLHTQPIWSHWIWSQNTTTLAQKMQRWSQMTLGTFQTLTNRSQMPMRKSQTPLRKAPMVSSMSEIAVKTCTCLMLVELNF